MRTNNITHSANDIILILVKGGKEGSGGLKECKIGLGLEGVVTDEEMSLMGTIWSRLKSCFKDFDMLSQ